MTEAGVLRKHSVLSEDRSCHMRFCELFLILMHYLFNPNPYTLENVEKTSVDTGRASNQNNTEPWGESTHSD